MKKLVITILTFGFGWALLAFQPNVPTVRAATVISTSRLTKAPYHAVSGYLYQSAALKKRLHNADHYPLTVFYADRAATVRKTNGNRAVYYRITNGNHRVHGWIWRGYLVRIINVQKQRAAINRLVSSIDRLSSPNKNHVLSLLQSIGRHDVLADLIKDFNQLSDKISDNNDLQKIQTIIDTLKSDGQTLIAIFNNGVNKLYTGVIALHHFNELAFSLANGLLKLVAPL